jgi:hypothetical protein
MSESEDSQPVSVAAIWRKALADHSLTITVILFVVLALKLLVIARGRVPVALAILQSASVATTLVGSALSATPLIAFLLTAWSISRLGSRARGEDGMRRGLARRPRLGLALTLAGGLVLGIVVSPWLVLVAGIAAGVLLRVVAPMAGRRRLDGLRRVALGVVAAAAAWAFWVFLDAVWVPHESVHVSRDTTIVGYVLDSGGQWTSILVSGDRLLVRVPSAHVTSRRICVLAGHRRNPLSEEAPSVLQLVADTGVLPWISRAPVPDCPTAHVSN